MVLWAISLVLIVFIILDLLKKINIIHPVFLSWCIPIFVNMPICLYFITEAYGTMPLAVSYVLLGILIYFSVRLYIFPVIGGVKVGFRYRLLEGAKPLIYADIYLSIFQAIILLVLFFHRNDSLIDMMLLYTTFLFTIACHLALVVNGAIRVCVGSRLVGVPRKLIFVFTMWMPVVNWIIWIPLVKLLEQEYKEHRERILWEQTITDNEICNTKYPLLLVHGVGFRDIRFLNYWGRIPRFLKKYGATIYYGNQEGLATIEQNGELLKNRIEEVLEESGAEKVNIIAHSKGGLDSRYAISVGEMGDKVASLTTMNTPHRGCKFADVAISKMNNKIYKGLSKFGDKVFSIYGDLSPDFHHTMYEFRTEDSRLFNEKCPDDHRVYYQSFTSVMSRARSDKTLFVPYLFIKKLGEENDGLVSIDSAKWGEFKGVFRNKHKRGLSHADIIDLHKEDIKGFNVFKVYTDIVSELKAMGF